MNLFRNDREGRLRAFWRLLFQFVLYTFGTVLLGGLAFAVFAFFGGATLGGEALEDLAASPTFLAANGVASLGAALVSVWLAGRFFDRRPFSGFGLRLNRDWWIDLGFGLFWAPC